MAHHFFNVFRSYPRIASGVGNLNRLLVTLGLARRSKPVQSLNDYLASRERKVDSSTDEVDE